MERLERKVIELYPETLVNYHANDLKANGYIYSDHSFRRQIDGTKLMVYYRQIQDTQTYEFGGIVPGEERHGDPLDD
jgi:hypothetical protein